MRPVTQLVFTESILNRIEFAVPVMLRGVHRVLVGKPEGKRPLERPRRRWEDNIKRDLQEVGGDCGTGWSGLRIGTGGGHL
jgi:hypothetical protein